MKMMAISEFDRIFWGPVDRSEISIRVNIDTAPQTAVNQLCATTLSGSQMRKFIYYPSSSPASNAASRRAMSTTASDRVFVCWFLISLVKATK